MTEREEQIQKLADAMAPRAGDAKHWAQWAAERLYDAGARIPDAPPPPKEPEVVVTEEAANKAKSAWMLHGTIEAEISAAFAPLLAANTAHPLVVEVVNRAIRERVAKIKLAPFSGVLADVAGQAVPRGALLTALGVAP